MLDDVVHPRIGNLHISLSSNDDWWFWDQSQQEFWDQLGEFFIFISINGIVRCSYIVIGEANSLTHDLGHNFRALSPAGKAIKAHLDGWILGWFHYWAQEIAHTHIHTYWKAFLQMDLDPRVSEGVGGSSARPLCQYDWISSWSQEMYSLWTDCQSLKLAGNPASHQVMSPRHVCHVSHV